MEVCLPTTPSSFPDGFYLIHVPLHVNQGLSQVQKLTISELVATCSKYLCPGTLACVSFPHHCPCAHPDVEDKVELGEGSAICISKGGFKPGEAARKIELARKGLL
jgi:hypothetical protein